MYLTKVQEQRRDMVVQAFGGSGPVRGFKLKRLYRDALITQIYKGTQQIKRLIIARELMKKGARG
jgi:alkylation response protein AidB-like acyl-CoA dehydrogenase